MSAVERKKVSETVKEYKVQAFAPHYQFFLERIHNNNNNNNNNN